MDNQVKTTNNIFEEARELLVETFQKLGLVTPSGNPICPACAASKKGQVALKKTDEKFSPTWKCYRCGERGSSIDAVLIKLSLDNTQARLAARIILGKAPLPKNIEKSTAVLSLDTRKSTADPEVYKELMQTGSTAGAIEFWGKWHISPEAVLESASVLLDDPKGSANYLMRRFGLSRLQKSGLVGGKTGDWFLFGNGSDNFSYSIIEPQTNSEGDILNMQFRATGKTAELAQLHKNWVSAGKDGGNDDQEKPPYVPRFVSLAGMEKSSQVGYGLFRLSQIEPSKVYILEGFKDLLAARTMGYEAYSIAGVSHMPTQLAINILSKHNLVLVLDGDSAGELGRESITKLFESVGLKSKIQPLREGYDMADVLIERKAHTGCSCETCTSFKLSHPASSLSCPCVTCSLRRNIKQQQQVSRRV